MWPFQNTVGIVGWVETIHPVASSNDFAFRLLQPGFHEHFSSARSDRERLVSVDVWTYGARLAELCRDHLKPGHRVQVYGRLVAAADAKNSPMLAIEAWGIERAEPLEAFRYVNHPWDYELKPGSERNTVVPLPMGGASAPEAEGLLS
jgi:hypothetical protein